MRPVQLVNKKNIDGIREIAYICEMVVVCASLRKYNHFHVFNISFILM